MRHWVKLWTEMLDDPKMGRLSDREHRVCTNLFCLAGIIDEDGRLLNTPDLAYKLRRSDVDGVEQDLRALATVNILEQDEAGVWWLVHYNVRNERPPSDQREAVRERVARYREKQRDGNESVTPLHQDVTSLEEEEIREDEISSSSSGSPDALDAFLQVRGGAINPKEVDEITIMVERAEEHRQSLARGSPAAPGANLTGDQWVAAVIQEAVDCQDGRGITLKYMKAILNRWIVQGFKSRMGEKENNGQGKRRSSTNRSAGQPGMAASPTNDATVERQREALRRKRQERTGAT